MNEGDILAVEKKFNRIFSIFIFLYFIAYWPIERGKYAISSKFYDDASQLLRPYDYFTISYVLNYIMFVLSIIGFILLFKRSNELIKSSTKQNNNNNLITLLLLFFFGYILFSLFIFNDYYSLKSKINIAFKYYLIFFIYLYSKFSSISTSKLIMSTGITNSFLIILQVVLNFNKLNSIGDIRTYRFSGGMEDSVIVTILLMITYVLIDNLSIQNKICLPIIKVVLIIACFLTGSRTWLILLAFYYVGKIFIKDKHNKLEMKKMPVLISIVILFFLIYIFNSDKINLFINNYYNLVFKDMNTIASNHERELKRTFAASIFYKNWLVGIGSQSYKFFETLYLGILGSNPHNIYLQILCENGVIGFVLFISLIASLIANLFETRKIIQVYLICLWLVSAYLIGLLDFMGLLIFVLIINCNEKHIVGGYKVLT